MVKSPPNIKEIHWAAKRRDVLRLNPDVLSRALVFHTEVINHTPQKPDQPLGLFNNLYHASVRRPLL